MNIIAHNISALNAQRQFGINTNNKAKTAEKLSSGYRINRASDDAAGLSISEKMRRQIRGLSQGTENTEAGVSLCQVADGALAEVHDMLHRITELSVKSANGTNSLSDRQAIQAEINEILDEIDRISETTTFNGKAIFEQKFNSADVSNIINTNNNTSTIFVDRNYSIEGSPIDKTILNYDISANANTGITVNGNVYAWDKIIGISGYNLKEQDIVPDTYSFEYNGLKISFDVTAYDNMDSITNALNKLQINMDYTPPKVNGINSISFKLYTPAESNSISKTEFASLIQQNQHTLIADNGGVKLNDNGALKSWSTIFSEAGIREDEAFKNGGILNLGETGKYDLNITFKAGMTVEDIVNEINGMTFEISGAIADNTIINAYNPCGTAITASCTKFSLSSALTEALGYDVLYGDSVMKAVYNDSGRTNSYPNALKIEFVPNMDVVTGVTNAYLVATTESMKELEQIFSTGVTTTSGSVTIDFISPSYPVTPTYGTSNVSIRWDYPAGITETDLWNAVGAGSPSPLFGADALDITIKTTYSTSGLQVNNIDIPEKISLQFDDTNVNNKVVLSEITNNNISASNVNRDVLQVWIQSGNDTMDGIPLEIDRMNTKILGINDLNVTSVEGAEHAMTAVESALEKLSANRSKIGAQQNRLEHTIRNQENTVENTTASESRIRDADMAELMVKYSKDNILEQAGHAMMAQANQSTSGILNLLQ